jgi:Spy/CpxP family protein refolding chaperone
MKTLLASVLALGLLGASAGSADAIVIHIGGGGYHHGWHHGGWHHDGWRHERWRHHGCRYWGWHSHHRRYCRGWW